VTGASNRECGGAPSEIDEAESRSTRIVTGSSLIILLVRILIELIWVARPPGSPCGSRPEGDGDSDGDLGAQALHSDRGQPVEDREYAYLFPSRREVCFSLGIAVEGARIAIRYRNGKTAIRNIT